MDNLCTPDSPLTRTEKQSIENGINDLKQEYPLATALFDKIEKSGIQIRIEIDPHILKGSIKYNKYTRTLTFISTKVVSSYGALEDWTHVAQCEIFYADQVISNRNLEFEAKMFCDINCEINGDGACAALELGFQQNFDLLYKYVEFKDKLLDGVPFSDLLEVYYEIGRGWNDPQYQEGIFVKQNPKLIRYFFK